MCNTTVCRHTHVIQLSILSEVNEQLSGAGILPGSSECERPGSVGHFH